MTNLTVDDRDLQALISLLETESEEHLALLRDQMRSFSDALLWRLAALAPSSSGANAYLNLVLAERDLPRLLASLREWVAHGADLEEGVLLVCQTGYPQVNTDGLRDKLDDLAAEIAVSMPAEEGIAAVRHIAAVLHQQQGFHGNADSYHDPENCYLNRVLTTRSGLPITLAVIWMLLGKRLDLPVSGVPLPTHFIASFSLPAGAVFVDPYHDGAILTVRDIMNIVSATGRVFHPNHLRSATSLQIVQRLFMNLLNSYQMEEDMERVRLVRQYLAVL